MRLKEGAFYGQEWRYEAISDLRKAIVRWIDYYNRGRIVTVLGMSPTKFRSQSLKIA